MPTPPPDMPPLETARSDQVEVSFDGSRCIHARYCVTRAPATFLANVDGPWIHAAATAVESLVAVIHQCPSGALHYRRFDGGPEEPPPPVNLVTLRENGPYEVRAPMRLGDTAPGFRAALCRCGASKNKPFCDNSHRHNGFQATSEPPSGNTTALGQRDGPVSVLPLADGPLRLAGSLEIVSGTGRIVERTRAVELCRCGASEHKPFCDDSHLRIGFRAPGVERPPE